VADNEKGSHRVKEEKSKKDEYQKALAAYGEAIKEFRKEKYDKAAEMLRTFIEKHPSERDLVDRAKTYIAVCEERAAENRESLPLKTADDCFHFGLYKANAGDFEEAQKLLEKAQKINPEDGKISYALADLFCLMGQPDVCLEHLKKAIQIDKFYRILAQNETDFEPLWEDKKFKLITRIA
jgi:tetratricopeptide (TPR) repeat protein